MADYVISLEIVGKDDASPAIHSAHKALVNIGGVAPGALGGVVSGLQRIAEFAVGGLIVGGIQKIGSALAEAGSQALKSYADYERLGMALTSLSAKELLNTGIAKDMNTAMALAAPIAKETLGWIQKLAIESPFTQEGVASAYRMAQAYGFTNKEAQRLTSAMIDFAAGSGASEGAMGTIALALGQIKAKGKLAGQEVLQLVNAGLSVDAILAKAFGKSTDEIVAMREKGLIPADKAIEAITKSLEQDFGGAAKRQSQTFSGLISSLSDIKEVGLREFFTGTFQAIQPYVAGFTDKLSSPEFMDKLREIGSLVGTNIAGAIKKVSELVAAFQTGGAGGLATALGISPEVQSTITSIIGTIERLFAATSKGGGGGLMEALNIPPVVIDAIKNVRDAVITLGDWIQKNMPIAQAAFQTAWTVIQGVVTTVVDIFKAEVLPTLQEAFQNITDALAELGLDWGDVWSALGTGLKAAGAIIGAVLLLIVGLIAGFAKGFAKATKTATATLKDMAKNFKGMIEGVSKIFAGLIEVVQGIFSGDLPRVFRGVKSEIDGLVQFITSAFKQAVKAITGPLDFALNFISGFVDGVVKFFKTLYDKLVGGSIIPDMMNTMRKIIVDTLEAISDFISSILNTIVGIFKSGFDKVISTVSSALNTLSGIVNSGFNALVGIIQGAWDAIRNGVATAWADITNAIAQAIQSIPAAVAWAIQSVVSIGTSIVTTIRDGISDTWETITTLLGEFLMGLASAVWNSDIFQSILEVGTNIVSSIRGGVATAWDSATGLIAKVKELLGGFWESVKDSMGNIVATGWNIVEAIKQGVINNWNNFVSWLRGMIGGIFGGGGESAQSLSLGTRATMPTGPLLPASATTIFNYNLYVTTSAPVSTVVQDFGMLQALAEV